MSVLRSRNAEELSRLKYSTMVAAGALTVFFATGSQLLARDLGQWASVDPSIYKWFQSLMQPDYPTISCCGSADAYYADSFESDGDRYVAIITDTRDDKPARAASCRARHTHYGAEHQA